MSAARAPARAADGPRPWIDERPARVLHLIETGGPGGAERVLLDIVRHLDPARFAPVVCLRKPGWLHDQCRALGVETVIVPLRRHLEWSWFRDVGRLLRRERIALLHAHEFAMNVYGAALGRAAGRRVVATVHGKDYYADRRRRRLAYRAVARLGAMVAVSEDVRGFLARTVGIPPGRITTIRNGIDVAAYRDAVPAPGVRAAALGGEWPWVVGTVGSLYPVKGHAGLLRAYRIVRERVPGTGCVIAGRGPLQDALRDEARRLGVEDGVRFLGFRGDVPGVLAALDVFALPSLSEGLPLAAIEAMAAGRPVVATDVGGTREVVVDGATGFLVPAGDPAALAERLVAVLREPALAARLGAAGRARAAREFGVARMVDRYAGLYDRLLASPLRGATRPVVLGETP